MSARKLKINGYPIVKAPKHHRANNSGYVYEHILVMEKKLGRQISSDEVIHHKDHNRANNRPDNLELVPNQSKHLKQHWINNRRRYL